MESGFAKSQLEKHGWTEGSGLGREQSGMKEAIKVKLKFDTAGVGHNAADEFTYKWWDNMYSKALDNIQVSNSEEGVTLKQTEAFEISKEKPLKKNLSKSDLLYGRFIKSSTLTNDGIEHKAAHDDSSSSDSEAETDKPFSALTDEDLYRICEGRTAHKGARHGLRANGKLKRIEEQEAGLSTPPVATPAGSDTEATNDSNNSGEKHKKKEKKLKKKHDCNDNDLLVSEQVENELKEKKKKKKKKKKKDKKMPEMETDETEIVRDEHMHSGRKCSKAECEGTVPLSENGLSAETTDAQPVLDEMTSNRKKKKKSKNKDRDVGLSSGSGSSPFSDPSTEQAPSNLDSETPLRKRKHKKKDKEIDNEIVVNEESSSPVPLKKKKKSKRKESNE